MVEIKNKKGEVIYTYIGKSLVGADLRYANLRDADLSNANLFEADLHGADLSGACLSNAYFNGANLSHANLLGADLSYANLHCADLRDTIIDETTKCLNNICPKTGSFIGYKKCFNYDYKYKYIVELEIPVDARRSSSTTNKCRCDKAKVLSITNLDGSKTDITKVHSLFNPNFVYKLGKIVTEPNFDERYWNECSSGIHFFMTREDAVYY